jgi:hypothetical protein
MVSSGKGLEKEFEKDATEPKISPKPAKTLRLGQIIGHSHEKGTANAHEGTRTQNRTTDGRKCT